jgi:two-component system sensor kinase
LAEGVRLLTADRPEDAAAVFEKALRIARRAGVMNAYVSPNLAWLATARRREFEQYGGRLPRRRRRLLAAADRAARRGVWIARRFQNDLPHALRERGLVLSLEGKATKALRTFQKSIAVARKQGAEHEESLTSLAASQLRLELGHADAAAQIHDADVRIQAATIRSRPEDARLKAAGQIATLSLADRFDTVLETGRQIAAALSPATIFSEVQRGALRLLRGERCQILMIDEHDRLESRRAGGRPVRGDGDRRIGSLRSDFRARARGGLCVGGSRSSAQLVWRRRKTLGRFRGDNRGRSPRKRRRLRPASTTERDP